MAYFNLKKPPQLYRGVFKFTDIGRTPFDLGMFTKKEEGLGWTRVYQMLVTVQDKICPSGKVEFVTLPKM